MSRRSGHGSWIVRLGVTLLILGLARIPLPVPDFHDFGPADGAGDVGSSHDHLLREHPEASARGGPVLHWRWVLLNPAELCGEPNSLGSEAPTCHPDWSACSHDFSPQFVASKPARRVAAGSDAVPNTDLPASLAGWSWAPARPAPAPRARSFVATYPPRTSIASLLQRWTC